MNKQELIEKIKANGEWLETNRYVEITKAIELINQIDEPQKVKVPKFVGELLDYYRNSTDVDLLALLICFKDWYFRKDKFSENEEAIDWLVKHPEKFMKAWLDGYEVEEEPKYIVPVPNLSKEFFYTADGEHISFCQRKNIDDVKSKEKFTMEDVERLFPELVDTVEKV